MESHNKLDLTYYVSTFTSHILNSPPCTRIAVEMDPSQTDAAKHPLQCEAVMPASAFLFFHRGVSRHDVSGQGGRPPLLRWLVAGRKRTADGGLGPTGGFVTMRTTQKRVCIFLPDEQNMDCAVRVRGVTAFGVIVTLLLF